MVKYENEDAFPLGWVWTTLGDSCHIIMGQSPPSETYNSEGVGLPFFQGKAEFGILHPKPVKWCSVPGKIAQPDDILISVRAPVGPTNLCKELSCIGRGLAAIRPELAMSNRYFFYLLRYVESGWEEKATGTTFSAISGDTLRNQLIPLAPLTEQHRIVEAIEAEFTRLDAGVAALKRLRANLKRYKVAVLKAAAEGKLVPQDPNDEPAADLLKRILRERRLKWEADQRAKGRDPQKLKYDEPKAPDMEGLPELPGGWVWASLDTLLDLLQYGTSVKADADQDNGVPILRMGNIQDGKLQFNSLKFISPEQEDIEKYRLSPEDLLINRTNSPELVGKTAIFQLDEVFTFASYLIRLRVNSSWSLPQYIMHIINSPWGQSYIARVRHQVAGQANINSQNIRDFPVPLPSLSEQQRIITQVELCFSIIDELRHVASVTLKRAERLRQAILRDAFAGRLVAQDPNDEPASELLKRIQKARKQRTANRTS